MAITFLIEILASLSENFSGRNESEPVGSVLVLQCFTKHPVLRLMHALEAGQLIELILTSESRERQNNCNLNALHVKHDSEKNACMDIIRLRK